MGWYRVLLGCYRGVKVIVKLGGTGWTMERA